MSSSVHASSSSGCFLRSTDVLLAVELALEQLNRELADLKESRKNHLENIKFDARPWFKRLFDSAPEYDEDLEQARYFKKLENLNQTERALKRIKWLAVAASGDSGDGKVFLSSVDVLFLVKYL